MGIDVEASAKREPERCSGEEYPQVRKPLPYELRKLVHEAPEPVAGATTLRSFSQLLLEGNAGAKQRYSEDFSQAVSGFLSRVPPAYFEAAANVSPSVYRLLGEIHADVTTLYGRATERHDVELARTYGQVKRALEAHCLSFESAVVLPPKVVEFFRTNPTPQFGLSFVTAARDRNDFALRMWAFAEHEANFPHSCRSRTTALNTAIEKFGRRCKDTPVDGNPVLLHALTKTRTCVLRMVEQNDKQSSKDFVSRMVKRIDRCIDNSPHQESLS